MNTVDLDLQNKSFEEIRAGLLRAHYVGEEASTDAVLSREKHLYELDIDHENRDEFSERMTESADSRDRSALAEMLSDLSEDLESLDRETDDAIRRIRLQTLKASSQT